MPFGKYKDKELTEIPRPYLCWLRTQEWVGGWLAGQCCRRGVGRNRCRKARSTLATQRRRAVGMWK
jgi:hypothetical protein